VDPANSIEEGSNILITVTLYVLIGDINQNPLNWRLIIDSSNLSLKAVLYDGSTIPSLPVGHSVHNVSYENMKILMETINYDKFKWQICGDLKVIVLLLGLQQGFTKYCCFICE